MYSEFVKESLVSSPGEIIPNNDMRRRFKYWWGDIFPNMCCSPNSDCNSVSLSEFVKFDGEKWFDFKVRSPYIYQLFFNDNIIGTKGMIIEKSCMYERFKNWYHHSYNKSFERKGTNNNRIRFEYYLSQIVDLQGDWIDVQFTDVIFPYNGTFKLILGPMFSGKTTELMRRYRRYEIPGKSCIMIKYRGDNRYDSEMVTTHDGIKNAALICNLLEECDPEVAKYDVICIDEVQFYKDAPFFCERWANQGKIVEACGLSGTYLRTKFEIISDLIPLAESITSMNAICKKTGEEAAFSKIITEHKDNQIEIIGGTEAYISVDRKTYFGK